MGKYHVTNYEQLSFDDFNQPTGLPINQNNRWVVRADNMPWHVVSTHNPSIILINW